MYLYEAENARSIVDAYGGSDLPMFDNEYNGGGTGITAWDQFRQGYPDVPYTATSVIQALDGHLDQLAPWTFTSVNGLTVNEGDGCDNAMIELTGECNGIAGTYNPMFYLYAQILKQLPFGSLTNVTLPGVPDLWGIQVANGSTRDVLVVNDNVATPRTFDLGPGFPVPGNLSTRLLDPANPEQPLETVLPLNTTSPTFTLPALGVLLLQFTPGSAAPPPVGNGGAPPTPHTVTFVRSGLPTGTNWSVALNGLIKASSTSSIVFPGLTSIFTYDIASVFRVLPCLRVRDGERLTGEPFDPDRVHGGLHPRSLDPIVRGVPVHAAVQCPVHAHRRDDRRPGTLCVQLRGPPVDLPAGRWFDDLLLSLAERHV